MNEQDFDAHENILEQAAAWRIEGRSVAIATVVKTWGSSPRPVGSQLVVDTNNNMIGSVSGGCIEGAVVHEAMKSCRWQAAVIVLRRERRGSLGCRPRMRRRGRGIRREVGLGELK